MSLVTGLGVHKSSPIGQEQKQTVSVYKRIESKSMDNLEKVKNDFKSRRYAWIFLTELPPHHQAGPGRVRDGVPHAAPRGRELLRGKVSEVVGAGALGWATWGVAPQQASGLQIRHQDGRVLPVPERERHHHGVPGGEWPVRLPLWVWVRADWGQVPSNRLPNPRRSRLHSSTSSDPYGHQAQQHTPRL